MCSGGGGRQCILGGGVKGERNTGRGMLEIAGV